MRIASTSASVRRFPLHGTWDGGVSFHDVVVVTVTTDTGAEGIGFAWTPRVGAQAVRAVIEEDCAPLLEGRDPAPAPRWEQLYAHLHEAGPGGITAMALAAVDIALWDLRARSFEVSLVELIGRRRDSVPCYGSGVNLDRSLEELCDQVRRFTAAGHTAVKMKVGSPDLERDLERVARVREILGPQGRLMVDANQRWDLSRASRALGALARFDPYWIEEPLAADDLEAHARLRAVTPIPFAIGENLRTVRAFRDALVRGVCDIAQPNVVRVGGITPFLRIADLAAAFSVPIAPHLLPDLSAQLAQCVPAVEMVEDIERASFADLGALERPSGVSVGPSGATSSTPPGHGLVFAAPPQ
ncbi:L-alanine-DL-glutamate epimerase-like enolase superfamily enzyme [Spinactinospora alkalitolerans]|uniref:L-alanine-DL-glutamate epimerase-like enolase superfamily enzyme n=1 Tax=Spinactinospora alkalitolerans TaxID=687207 RepID=A0A852U3S1_9ACTN|nr:mandelate racemase/muconate lactonizing enzyme family protein [Spinactinospora alkalitolerans]NYE50132.1 L-alanine-DL-glutamate epimerase-like enolase superfamily enzyme [Spinactinospora alkalitolerans]